MHRLSGKVFVLPVLFMGIQLASTQAEAAPIFQLTSGSLTVTALISSAGPTFDIRGGALFTVSDSGIPPSLLAIYDSTGGTDPTAAVIPFGNAALIGADINSSSTGILDVLLFDFSSATTTPTILNVPATFTVFPSGSAASALLTDLVNAGQITFSFDISNFVDLGNGTQIAQWQVSSFGSAVPEPSTLSSVTFVLLPLGAFVFFRRRSQKREMPGVID